MRRLFYLLILILTACGPATIVPITTPTMTVIPSSPSLTATLQPPRPICPSAGNPSDPVAPSSMSLDWIYGTILDYLNQGGSPEKLTSELAYLKYDLPNSNTKMSFAINMNRLDINNDGVDELVFSSGALLFDNPGSDGVDSGLWVFQCQDGKYKNIYQDEILNSYEGNPRLVAVADLFGNKQKEIVIRSTWSGDGCLQYFKIIGWKNNSPIDHFVPISFPCGTEFAVGGQDINGNKEILFHGWSDIRYDSMGGVSREFVDTYELNYQAYIPTYILVSHYYLPSPYRIGALYEAQEALNTGDFDLAIQLYDKAAHDEKLQDINSFCFSHQTGFVCAFGYPPKNLGAVDHPKEYLTAFALFRLTLLYLRSGNEPKVQSTLNELDINYPAGSFGSEFADAAHLLNDQFETGKGLALACNAVASLIENKYPLLEWHFDWSMWTIFDYTNETFCPYSADVNGLWGK